MKIESIVKALGGPANIGRACAITPQAVSQWDEVPARFVLLLAASGMVTPHQMRPDLYPHKLDGMRGWKRAPYRKANGKPRRTST